eukprot:scaffold126326_cov39-Tisochrysis_lutea.AAC.1
MKRPSCSCSGRARRGARLPSSTRSRRTRRATTSPARTSPIPRWASCPLLEAPRPPRRTAIFRACSDANGNDDSGTEEADDDSSDDEPSVPDKVTCGAME